MQSHQNPKKVNSHVTMFVAMILTAASLFLGGCGRLPLGYVTIRDITANPAQYEGKTIMVRGKVSDITKIPFVNIRYYTITDNSSKITVIPKGDLPAIQENIIVIGTLENITIIENQGFGFHVKEINRID